MFAGIGVVRAGAIGLEVPAAMRQQVQIEQLEGLFDSVRHFVEQQPGDVSRAAAQVTDEQRPVVIADGLQPERGFVGRFLGDAVIRIHIAANLCRDFPVRDFPGLDAVVARISPTPGQPGGVGKSLQCLDKSLTPPGPNGLHGISPCSVVRPKPDRHQPINGS